MERSTLLLPQLLNLQYIPTLMKLPFDSPDQDVRIDLVPLIDVIFCILTFFILAAVTLTRQAALDIQLPTAASGAPQMRKLLLVGVDRVGQAYIEKQPVTPDQLYGALVRFQQTNPDGKIVLSADRYASYNDVVQVLDLLKSVGGERVALATQSRTETTYPIPNAAPGADGQLNLPSPSGLGNPPDSNLAPLPGLNPAPSQPGGTSGSAPGLMPAPEAGGAAPGTP